MLCYNITIILLMRQLPSRIVCDLIPNFHTKLPRTFSATDTNNQCLTWSHAKVVSTWWNSWKLSLRVYDSKSTNIRIRTEYERISDRQEIRRKRFIERWWVTVIRVGSVWSNGMPRERCSRKDKSYTTAHTSKGFWPLISVVTTAVCENDFLNP